MDGWRSIIVPCALAVACGQTAREPSDAPGPSNGDGGLSDAGGDSGSGGTTSDASTSDATASGGEGPASIEECDCAETVVCLSASEAELMYCPSAGNRSALTRVSWEGCSYVGVRVMEGHWNALYVYDSEGDLVGFGGGDAFYGSYYSCGNLAPCGDSVQSECVLCEGMTTGFEPCED